MHSYYIVFIVLFFIIIMNRKKKRRNAAVIMQRRKKGKKIMGEIIKEFVGKEVIIYTISDSASIQGTVESVNDNWVTVKGFDSGEAQVVNLEYVIRVREFPKDKNGKRKMIFD